MKSEFLVILIAFNVLFSFLGSASLKNDFKKIKTNVSLKDPSFNINIKEASQISFKACIVPLSLAALAIEGLNQERLPLELQFTSEQLDVFKEKENELLVTIIRMEHKGNFKILPHSSIQYLVENAYHFSSISIPNYTNHLNVTHMNPKDERVKYWVVPSDWTSMGLPGRYPCPVRITDIKWIRLNTDSHYYRKENNQHE